MKLKAIQKYINQLKICLEVFKYESKDPILIERHSFYESWF